MLVSLSTGARYRLLQSTHYGALEPGQFYSTGVSYTIPPSLSTSRYNLTAQTDFRNHVFEFNSDGNNIRWKEIRIEEHLSNLLFTNVVVSVQTDAEGNRLAVNYTITNNGTGPTLNAPWIDTLAFSFSQLYSNAQARPLSRVLRHNDLVASEGYSPSVVAFMPRDAFGQVFLHLLTDSNRRIVEEDESDNVYSIGPFTLPPVFPDLSALNLTAVDGEHLVAGDPLRINWTVANEGNGLLRMTRRVDTIYISTSQELSQSTIKLADIQITTSLQLEERYTWSAVVQTTPDLVGSYYLIVSVNRDRRVDENGRLLNNIASTQVDFSVPPTPDFAVSTIDYSYIESERVLTVFWAVLNEGNSMRATNQWNDQVFLSPQPAFDRVSAIRLGSTAVSAQLSSSQSYQSSMSFLIPVTAFGHYHVHVEVDSSNTVAESFGEGNNIGRSSDRVEIPQAPSLGLSVEINITNLPTMLVAGQTFVVEYIVVNTGEVNIGTDSWVDGVYLTSMPTASRDIIINLGILLTQVVNNRQLSIGESYSVSVNVTVPYSVNELMHIVVVVDINEDLGDASQVDGNTYFPTTTPISIVDGPLSDLTVLSTSNSLSFRGGEPATIPYMVLNKGENSAVGTWYEAIYLSADALLDAFDTRLKSIISMQSLSINESYTQSAVVFVPYDLTNGAYYLIFQVDVSDHIFELNETNNIARKVVMIEETVSTDIVLASVTASPANLEYGSGKCKFDVKRLII